MDPIQINVIQPVAPTRAHCAGFAVALTCLLVAAAVRLMRRDATSSRKAKAASPPSSTRARFRLTDGREVRLAGIEPVGSEKANRTSALAAIVAGREVKLSGEDDAPDRYGRQPALVFLDGSDTPVQSLLLAQGEALVSTTVTDKECAAILTAAEAAARQARRGTWADPAAIKNAESPGDILAGIGRFTLVEGKVLSVRQAGATTYLNFGRNWTRDFAVTISRRAASAFEAAGIALKSLENRRIRVRGWVESRGGPRIEVLRVGQIELLGGN